MKNFYLLITITFLLIFFFNIYLSIIFNKFNFLKKIRNSIFYLISSLVLFVFLDFYVYKILGHGFPSSLSQEKFERSPSPYDMFAGKPFYKDHNRYGFRGEDFKNNEKETIQIAFFGGSTGYNGDPPIPDLIEKNLSNSFKVKIFNFSSVSSNHNQHLHRLLKYSNFKFDLVIFYGGYNETIQTYLYDPRPGYPFNYWIRNELNKIKYLLLKYSSIYAEFEKYTGKISNLSNIRKNINYFDESWLNKLILNYEDTLEKAKSLSNNFIVSNACEKTKFIAFFQPISKNKIDDFSNKILFKINEYFNEKEIIIDLSGLINEELFTDSVHINQQGRIIVANYISKNILDNLLNDCI